MAVQRTPVSSDTEEDKKPVGKGSKKKGSSKKGKAAPVAKLEDGDIYGLVKAVSTDLNDQFGEGEAIIMNDGSEGLNIPFWIVTGIPQLDYAVGGVNHPGLPGGRIIEIFGAESSGKTTLALWILSRLLFNGGIGMYQDSEFALSDERAEVMGIDKSAIIYSQPETLEQVFKQQEAAIDTIRKYGNSDVPVGIFLDSVAACTTESELEGDFGDAVVGIHARLMSQALRKIRGTINKQKIMAVYVNQIRDKIGVVYGDKTETFGGRALKFYSTVRIQVSQIEKVKLNEKSKEYIGTKVKFTIRKNKVAPPFKECEVRMLFSEGIDQAGAILDWLKDNGMLGDETGYYTINSKKYRFNDARNMMLEDDDLFQELLDLSYTI